MDKVLTYRVRLRRPPTSLHEEDAWLDGSSRTHPLVVQRQCGTYMAGWWWDRKEVPCWENLGAAKDMTHVTRIIKAHADEWLAGWRSYSEADRVREAFGEPKTISVTFTLGATPEEDNYVVNE